MDTPSSIFIQQWHDGDRRALEKVLERHLPWIQSYVHRKISSLLRSKTETGDIVQDAVVQFLKYGPRFHLSSDRQLRALLCRIVENVLRDKYDWYTAHRRSIARERPLPPDTVLNLDAPRQSMETPSQVVLKHEQEAWVRLALELLDPPMRHVIILREWEGLTFNVIGQRLKVSRDTARRRYMHSLLELMKKVKALRSGALDEALGAGEGSDE
jgi:RNA polymerase sigma-70 factor (ECF subfamily)